MRNAVYDRNAEPPDGPSRRNPVWWYGVSACTDENRSLFFGGGWDQTKAKAICAGCICRMVCLYFGASMEDPSNRNGVFGGLGVEERKAAFKGQDQDDIYGTYVVLRSDLAKSLGRAA